MGSAACKTDTRYFILMQKKDRKPKARPSGEKWFVYIVRCGDGSLYTGITKDVKRRCQQHNAGTASRYTRSRRPVKLVYHESRPDQSSALKREAAIKAMSRQGKLTIMQKRKKPAKGVREIAHLEDIPNIGPPSPPICASWGSPRPATCRAVIRMRCTTNCAASPASATILACSTPSLPQSGTWRERTKKPWWKYTAERKRELEEREAAK